jgi:hypothetical protein
METKDHAAVIAGGDPPEIETFQPDGYVLAFDEIDERHVAVVGGKGAHLRASASRRTPSGGSSRTHRRSTIGSIGCRD